MRSASIFYIAIGDYVEFFEGFLESCESKFLNDFEKKYFVFTDRPDKVLDVYDRVVNSGSKCEIVQVEDLGWPLNTLFRFRYFLMRSEMWRGSDICVFFNANALVLRDIEYEELLGGNSKLFGVIHPGYKKRRSIFLPYENRIRSSSAFVSRLEAHQYAQGSFNGGEGEHFLALCMECDRRIMLDLKQNIIARAHDESHINRYFLDCIDEVNYVSEYLSWPEVYGECSEAAILMRDKGKYAWYSGLKKAKGGVKVDVMRLFLTAIKKVVMERW